MISKEIISKLQTMSSEKYRKNVIKLGIPAESSIGVSTGDIRKYAKSIEKSKELAFELWNSGYHEAKLLAVLLFEKRTVTIPDIERMMKDVLKELETLIKVEGRGRLISSDSKMGKV